MANFQMKDYNGPSLENGHIDFPSLYLKRFDSGENKNQHVVIEGCGSTDLGLTSIVDCGIYDGVDGKANLVARAKGMRMNADHSWCNLFVIVFDLDGYKGSTLEVMGATMEKEDGTAIEEKGEWAIVGGTGEFAMARGLITRKRRLVVDGGEILELSLEAYCRTTKVQLPAPKKNGPWGTDPIRGSIHELDTAVKPRRLESVTVRSTTGTNRSGAINAISFSYIDEAGEIREPGPWGGASADSRDNTPIIFNDPSEFVTEISGSIWNNTHLSRLTIVTNLKTYGPFGDMDEQRGSSTAFNFPVQRNETVVGFFATYASNHPYLTSIGVYTA